MTDTQLLILGVLLLLNYRLAGAFLVFLGISGGDTSLLLRVWDWLTQLIK